MAKNYFKSYIWLLETLQSKGPVTLKELQDLWMRSSVNDEGRELAPRTFANHTAAIADIFGIDIVCNRSDNTYYIENESDLNGGGVREWLMEALSLNNLINESAGLRTRILFESEPSSHRFLSTIIRAIRDEKMIVVNYQAFTMHTNRDYLLEPYCLKEYKRRWYLFARHHLLLKNKEPHAFALDRMHSVTISEEVFKLPKSFDAQAFFSNRYGIAQFAGEKPARIKIKVGARQANYLRTLPMHPSQKETEQTDEYSIFTFRFAPNYDFIHDILAIGDEVEILEPAVLREDISRIVNNLKKKYAMEEPKVTKKKGVYLGMEPDDDYLYGTFSDTDALVDSEKVEDRIRMAKWGYGVDKLKDDPDPRVRLEVAKGQYYVQQFLNDPDPEVRAAARKIIGR